MEKIILNPGYELADVQESGKDKLYTIKKRERLKKRSNTEGG